MSAQSSHAITVETVLNDEIAEVDASRKLRFENPHCSSAEKHQNLIGLAFSGGGIRSATFNLGILQALARERLLRAFDYVSTVSGGGYIGSWLMAWMHHQGLGIQEIEKRLSQHPNLPKECADAPELHFLRSYSNYLTPKKGLLGADFWAFVGSYLRNTLLNQTILVLALLSILLAPRTFVYVIHLLENLEEFLQPRLSEELQTITQSQYLAMALGIVLAGFAVNFIGRNLVSVDLWRRSSTGAPSEVDDPWYTKSWAVQAVIVVPLLLSAALLTYGLGESCKDWGALDFPLPGGPVLVCLLYFALWGFALVARAFAGRKRNLGSPNKALILITAAISGLTTGFLFIPFARILVPTHQTFNIWHAMTFGAPLMVGIMLITGVLHIGLMGRGMSDAHREWWGRLGGLLMIHVVIWFVLFLIVVYFPYGVGQLELARVHRGWTASAVLAWMASTAYGVLFGKSDSDSSGLSILGATPWKKLLHYAARVTPYIFILGVMLGLSLLASAFCAWVTDHGETTVSFPSDWYFSARTPIACCLLFAAAILLSWRVDINEFSTHYLYRNRLVRCYIGASSVNRHQQPFTGFSEKDDFALAHLEIPKDSQDPKDARPLPILNTSLNVVRGKELAVQTRKARSFAFTPLYGGFTRQKPGSRDWEPFFGRTKDAGSKRSKDGITLGSAMAISGAAASPNMGSYSQPSLAFLMTLFDVRLGWWIGSPTRKLWKFEWWKRGSPILGFGSLICELLGDATDDGNFLYLSDGGHFENLAIYELVRRRCKLIVACDASCDEDCTMSDLHNAMEHCRTDFGVKISFKDSTPLRAIDEQGELRSKAHFLEGEIEYPGLKGKGTIIYIKSSLVSKDPEDVLAYAKTNCHFPHDSTANQWFDEAHFENYRALGEAAGKAAVERIAAATARLVGYDPAKAMKANA